MALTLPLALLLGSIASPLMSGIFGSGKQKTSTPFKGWMSPSLGMQDPYLLNAIYKRGLQYGIGDQDMFGDIQGVLSKEWPLILKKYQESQSPTVNGRRLRP